MARWPSETFVGASAAACALTVDIPAGGGRLGCRRRPARTRHRQQRPAGGSLPAAAHRHFPTASLGLADLIYASPAGFRPVTLDLYLPAQRRMPLPTIVFVHGGGWTGGHSRQAGAFENWPRVLASIAARGYVVASVNYRLSSEAVSPAAERGCQVGHRLVARECDAPCHRYFTIRYLGRLRRRPARRTRGHIL